jgi:NAD(P)-dependent dehydrogenase (short-subunit alcohol dehydrogenase family)
MKSFRLASASMALRCPTKLMSACYTRSMVRGYEGRVAVVTGAANGLGRALAGELAARKCHLALIDVDSSALENATQELAERGIAVTHHIADVGSQQDLERVAMEIGKAHGTTHLLVNNAAISASAAFSTTSDADFERSFGQLFWGGARLPSFSALPPGKRRRADSQRFAWLGYPGKTAYASSKAAIRAFSESLRLELADHGVGVSVLYPGPMHTALVRSGISDSQGRRERENRFLETRGASPERVACIALDRLLANPAES